MKKLKIAFDIDDTLWKIVAKFPYCNNNCKIERNECQDHRGDYHQVPDYDLIQVLRWFFKNDNKIYVWSAGGIDYAKQIVDKLGLTEMVEVIEKTKENSKLYDIDIVFDDEITNLAKVDILVKRDR